MATEPIMSPELMQILMNTYGDEFNSGDLIIYQGAVPANFDAAAGTTLATLEFVAEAFQAATDADPSVAESLEAEITAEAAEASGEMQYFRMIKNGAAGVGFQGTVATATADLIMNVEEATLAAQVSVETLDFSLASGA